MGQKIDIKVEGVVTAVDGDTITVEDGTVFTITDETVFGVNEDHTDGVKEASEEITSGNHSQGYLNGGNTAKTIYENNAPASSGKICADFEGVAAAVDGSVVTLEDGRYQPHLFWSV